MELEAAESKLHTDKYVRTIFMCHLTIEKMPKALVVEKNEKPASFIKS